jgi:hypothetical protein
VKNLALEWKDWIPYPDSSQAEWDRYNLAVAYLQHCALSATPAISPSRTQEADPASHTPTPANARAAIERAVAKQKGKCCDNCNCCALKALYDAAPLSESAALLPGLKAALEIAERYLPNEEMKFLRNDIKDAIMKAAPAPSGNN